MRFYFFIGIFLLDLVACHKDDSVEKEGAGRTIIVYLGVDNNFSGEGAEKIKALTEGWRGKLPWKFVSVCGWRGGGIGSYS